MNIELEDDIIRIKLEEFEGHMFIHVHMHQWNKEAYRHCAVLLEDLKEAFDIYAYIPNAKVRKFAEVFNFQDTDQSIELTTGEVYPVMRAM